ncbi:hypothetical protein ACKGJI_08875 [Sulfurospirillum sp. 1307]
MNIENTNIDEMKSQDEEFTDELLNDGLELASTIVDLDEKSKKLKDDEMLVVSKQKKRKVSAPYAYVAVGNGKKLGLKDAEASIDIIKEMVDMRVNGRRALDKLKDCMLSNDHIFGIIKIKSSSWTKKEKDNWQDGIKELMSKDFVRRVKRAQYIINPKLLVPTGDPTVEKYLSQEEKAKRHLKYINTVMSNWSKLNTTNLIQI